MLDRVEARLAVLDAEEICPGDLARLLDLAAKVQRSALGEPARVEVSGRDGGPVAVADATPEERLQRLDLLAREAARRLNLQLVAAPVHVPHVPPAEPTEAEDKDDGADALTGVERYLGPVS